MVLVGNRRMGWDAAGAFLDTLFAMYICNLQSKQENVSISLLSAPLPPSALRCFSTSTVRLTRLSLRGQVNMWSIQKKPEFKEIFEGPEAAEEARRLDAEKPRLSVSIKRGQ